MPRNIKVFFRDDDPDTREFGDMRAEVRELSELFIEQRVPLIQAVVPRTVSEDTVVYFQDTKRRYPGLIEIIQHGYRHRKYSRGEFDDTRSYHQQFTDIKNGMGLMKRRFGSSFFPGFTFPFGAYNEDSLRVLDNLGFRVLSCYWKDTLKHSVSYSLAHLIKQGPIFSRHISYHTKRFKRYNFYELSPCINVIQSLTPIWYHTATELYGRLLRAARRSSAIGFVLHYNTLRGENKVVNLGRLRDLLRMLKDNEDVEFITLQDWYERNR